LASFARHLILPAPHLLCRPGSMAATQSATQPSIADSRSAASSKVKQSLGCFFELLFFSSFSKQPVAGSAPPSNFALALSRQFFAFRSVGLPGVLARRPHFSRPLTVLETHDVFPARQRACPACVGWGASAAGAAAPPIGSLDAAGALAARVDAAEVPRSATSCITQAALPLRLAVALPVPTADPTWTCTISTSGVVMTPVVPPP